MNSAPRQRTCVLVLGMHRSGTSAVTRVLNLLGATLPREMLGAQHGNELGHWEPARLLARHDQLLADAGSSWDDWRQLDLSTLSSEDRLSYRRDVLDLVADDFGDADLFVIKDPRICRFADYFAEVLRAEGIRVRFILPIRRPAAIAASLEVRNGFSREYGDLLCLAHFIGAEAATRGLDRLIVDYDDLVDRPSETSRILADWLFEHEGMGPTEAVRAATASVDEAFRHTQADAFDRIDTPANRAYRLLRGLSLDPKDAAYSELDQFRQLLALATPFATIELNKRAAVSQPDRGTTPSNAANLLRAFDEWNAVCADISTGGQQLSESAATARMLAQDTEALRIELNHAHQELRALRASLSWRASAPIRLVGRLSRGEMAAVVAGFGNAGRRTAALLPKPVRRVLTATRNWISGRLLGFGNSSANFTAIQRIVAERSKLERSLSSGRRSEVPIDISTVIFNDRRWLRTFSDSVIALDYPKRLLSLTFVDNGSSDGSLDLLEEIALELRRTGMQVSVVRHTNKGYGAGHNVGIARGTSEFVLVTNVDLEFEKDALSRIVEAATSDHATVAAWELRQLPFEHPKYYDPVVGLTNWNSHACVLLRRSAVAAVGGYDDSIFMYGEDVELSYRLRRDGYLLRYVPRAAVTHHSFESVSDIKPLQFSGSTLSNFYLRLKYGRPSDMLAAPLMLLGLPMSHGLPPNLKAAAWANVRKAPALAWRALASRRRTNAPFPFRRWDYEMIRDGAEFRSRIIQSPPLVSVITRTVEGREQLLYQAMASVRNQTYGAVEHIIVQDGGAGIIEGLDRIPTRQGLDLRILAIPKGGRSAAGNAGLRAAHGKWCVFLDDDDLLFADHLESLVAALQDTGLKAAYSLAWEVPTEYADGRPGASYTELTHRVPSVFRQDFDRQVLVHHNFLPIQSVLFERSLFEERGGFEEDLHALEDWVLWNKYAVRNRFTFVRKTTSLFRVPASPELSAERISVLTDAYPVARSRMALNEARYSVDERPAVEQARGGQPSPTARSAAATGRGRPL